MMGAIERAARAALEDRAEAWRLAPRPRGMDR